MLRVGELDFEVIAALRAEGIVLNHDLDITMTIREIRHSRRRHKVDPLSDRDLASLPGAFAQPQAVLLDKGKDGKGSDLLYIFEAKDAPAGKHGRAIVRVGYKAYVKKPRGQPTQCIPTNSVRSARYANVHALRGKRYKLLKGAL